MPRYPRDQINDTFEDTVLFPGFPNPHLHVVFGGTLYGHPLGSPWPMAVCGRVIEGCPDRMFLWKQAQEIVDAAPADGHPVVVYGYHNLVQGDRHRGDLDGERYCNIMSEKWIERETILGDLKFPENAFRPKFEFPDLTRQYHIEDNNRQQDAKEIQSRGKFSPIRELLEQLFHTVFRPSSNVS